MAGNQFVNRGVTKGAAAKKKMGTKGTAVAHPPVVEVSVAPATDAKPPAAMPPVAPAQAPSPNRIDEMSQGAQGAQESPVAEAPATPAPAPIHSHAEISMGGSGNGASTAPPADAAAP